MDKVKKNNQLELLRKIQDININIVTCPQCRTVLIIEINKENKCKCNFKGKNEDFADLYY